MNAYSCIKDYTNNLKYESLFLQEVDSIILRKELSRKKNAFVMEYCSDERIYRGIYELL